MSTSSKKLKLSLSTSSSDTKSPHRTYKNVKNTTPAAAIEAPSALLDSPIRFTGKNENCSTPVVQHIERRISIEEDIFSSDFLPSTSGRENSGYGGDWSPITMSQRAQKMGVDVVWGSPKRRTPKRIERVKSMPASSVKHQEIRQRFSNPLEAAIQPIIPDKNTKNNGFYNFREKMKMFKLLPQDAAVEETDDDCNVSNSETIKPAAAPKTSVNVLKDSFSAFNDSFDEYYASLNFNEFEKNTSFDRHPLMPSSSSKSSTTSPTDASNQPNVSKKSPSKQLQMPTFPHHNRKPGTQLERHQSMPSSTNLNFYQIGSSMHPIEELTANSFSSSNSSSSVSSSISSVMPSSSSKSSTTSPTDASNQLNVSKQSPSKQLQMPTFPHHNRKPGTQLERHQSMPSSTTLNFIQIGSSMHSIEELTANSFSSSNSSSVSSICSAQEIEYKRLQALAILRRNKQKQIQSQKK